MYCSDGGEEILRVVGGQARVRQVTVIEHMVSEQGGMIGVVKKTGIDRGFQETADQHCKSFIFYMMEAKATMRSRSVADHLLRLLQKISQ